MRNNLQADLIHEADHGALVSKRSAELMREAAMALAQPVSVDVPRTPFIASGEISDEDLKNMKPGPIQVVYPIKEARDKALEEAEDAMLGAFASMDRAYLFTSGFDSRIIDARDAIRALKSRANSDGSIK